MKTTTLFALCGALFVMTACDGDKKTPAGTPGAEADKPAGGMMDAAKKMGGDAAEAAKKAADAAAAEMQKKSEEAAAAAKKTMEENAAKLADAATAAKAEAIKGLKAQIDALQPQLAALQKHGESLDPVKKTAFNPIMDGLNKQFGDAMKSLSGMGTATDWQSIQTKLGPMLDQLKSGITTATKTFM